MEDEGPALRRGRPGLPGRLASDQDRSGTRDRALRKAGGRIVGYLNITPQGGDETLANWASFRPAHNREEGDHDLVPMPRPPVCASGAGRAPA